LRFPGVGQRRSHGRSRDSLEQVQLNVKFPPVGGRISRPYFERAEIQEGIYLHSFSNSALIYCKLRPKWTEIYQKSQISPAHPCETPDLRVKSPSQIGKYWQIFENREVCKLIYAKFYRGQRLAEVREAEIRQVQLYCKVVRCQFRRWSETNKLWSAGAFLRLRRGISGENGHVRADYKGVHSPK
jgi:hypothetical protein